MLSQDEPASNPIVIVPAAERYTGQMEQLMTDVYHIDPRDEAECCFNGDHFRHHLSIFPEGQFVAVEQATDRVVGLTVSMRIAFDPRQPILKPWWELTGYG